jgi:membrane-associated protease RseP (regulator of RpoE activity)
MNRQSTWKWSALALATFALAAFATTPLWARGGGGGGGMHGGGAGMHGGMNFGGAGMHGGGFANAHPYHPSQFHFDQHADQYHNGFHPGQPNNFARYNHHYDGWHNGGWGPGFWGGAAVGYGLGYAYAPWGWGDGGDTYIDNSTDITPAYNDGDYATDDSGDVSSENADDSTDNASPAPNAAAAAANGFPTDEWPELGITTYAGEYGASQGQVVVRIVPGSAAANAGFVPGDVILSLNGQPTPSANSMDQVLDSAKGQFSASVWDARTGRTSTLTGTLGPNAAPAAPAQPAPSAAVSQQ